MYISWRVKGLAPPAMATWLWYVSDIDSLGRKVTHFSPEGTDPTGNFQDIHKPSDFQYLSWHGRRRKICISPTSSCQASNHRQRSALFKFWAGIHKGCDLSGNFTQKQKPPGQTGLAVTGVARKYPLTASYHSLPTGPGSTHDSTD